MPSNTTSDMPENDNHSAGELATADAWLPHARTIADAIAEQAIDIGNGAITWIQPRFFMHSHRHQLQPIGYSIFTGSCGISLFLAAMARASGEGRYGLLARSAVQQLCRSLDEHGELVASEMGIGGALGLGSVVYALTRISGFLGDSSLLAAASRAAQLIDARRIANDQALDVIAGSAGAILGLLALYEASHDQCTLDRAITCGNHLLQARTMNKAGCLAWPTLRKMHTTGFSHGTAGIVYALLRLYAVTGDRRLLSAAREGLTYEDHAFLSKDGNWAEIFGDEEPAWVTWCHGAPGIGLARIGGLPMLDSTRIRQDIEVALQTTQQVRVTGHDHLCCGNSGRAEILLTAAQKLARPELADAAKHNMQSILTRTEQKGSFLLDTLLPRWVTHIAFFQGTSGIGYTLLRMAYPDILPSVLMWE
jgi:type 2 lantibiotic biosynthesis protein LanM